MDPRVLAIAENSVAGSFAERFDELVAREFADQAERAHLISLLLEMASRILMRAWRSSAACVRQEFLPIRGCARWSECANAGWT